MDIFIYDVENDISLSRYKLVEADRGEGGLSELGWMRSCLRLFTFEVLTPPPVGSRIDNGTLMEGLRRWAKREFEEGLDENLDIEVFSDQGRFLGRFTVLCNLSVIDAIGEVADS